MPQVVICILFALLGLSDKFFGHQSLLFSLSSPIKVHSETHLGHFVHLVGLLLAVEVLFIEQGLLMLETTRAIEEHLVDMMGLFIAILSLQKRSIVLQTHGPSIADAVKVIRGLMRKAYN